MCHVGARRSCRIGHALGARVDTAGGERPPSRLPIVSSPIGRRCPTVARRLRDEQALASALGGGVVPPEASSRIRRGLDRRATGPRAVQRRGQVLPSGVLGKSPGDLGSEALHGVPRRRLPCAQRAGSERGAQGGSRRRERSVRDVRWLLTCCCDIPCPPERRLGKIRSKQGLAPAVVRPRSRPSRGSRGRATRTSWRPLRRRRGGRS